MIAILLHVVLLHFDITLLTCRARILTRKFRKFISISNKRANTNIRKYNLAWAAIACFFPKSLGVAAGFPRDNHGASLGRRIAVNKILRAGIPTRHLRWVLLQT